MLPETDICSKSAEIKVEWGGEKRKWGKNAHVEFCFIHGIPTLTQWRGWSLEEQEEKLNELLAWADAKDVPNNSQVRETLCAMVSELAQRKVEQTEREWKLMVSEVAVGKLASSLVVRKAHFSKGQAHEMIKKAVEELAQIGEPIEEPPKPAPGYHDSNAFPELDEQKVPIEADDGSAGGGKQQLVF